MRGCAAMIGLVMLAGAAQAAESPKVAAIRSGTPTFTASSDNPLDQIVRCVEKASAWSGAQRTTTDHGVNLSADKMLLEVAEEGDRRRVALWPATDARAGEAPAAAEMPHAGAQLAAVKACI